MCCLSTDINRQNTVLLWFYDYFVLEIQKGSFLLGCHKAAISNLYYIFMDPLCGVIHDKTSHFGSAQYFILHIITVTL